MLEMRPVDWKRPAFPHQPHVGQRLLQAHATGWSFDDEDKIEITVANFSHGPILRSSTEHVAYLRTALQKSPDTLLGERRITCTTGKPVFHGISHWRLLSSEEVFIGSVREFCGRSQAPPREAPELIRG